eukprot:gene3202-2184_t
MMRCMRVNYVFEDLIDIVRKFGGFSASVAFVVFVCMSCLVFMVQIVPIVFIFRDDGPAVVRYEQMLVVVIMLQILDLMWDFFLHICFFYVINYFLGRIVDLYYRFTILDIATGVVVYGENCCCISYGWLLKYLNACIVVKVKWFSGAVLGFVKAKDYYLQIYVITFVSYKLFRTVLRIACVTLDEGGISGVSVCCINDYEI